MGNFIEIEKRLFEIFNITKAKNLAEIMGVTQSTYGNWRQRNKIPYDEIITICVKYNHNVNYVLTGIKEDEKIIKIDFEKEILEILKNSSEKEKECFYHLIKAEVIKKEL